MTIEKMNQKYTWQAMITVMEAIIDFSHRYADLAEKMASECKDEKRRRQLLTMAENCRLVPENRRKHSSRYCRWCSSPTAQ